MSKTTIEKLILALFALPALALFGKGGWALVTGSIWISPRHSAPVLLQGAPAYWSGVGYVLLGAGLLAAVSMGLKRSQKQALTAALVLFGMAAGAFTMSFLAR